MAAHPKCPCTRASLDELAAILTRSPKPVTCYVLFWRPPELPGAWARTSLWDKASEIPGVMPVDDVGGREALRFGATTSGQVFLFDRAGALRFSGGLTSARGAVGDSAGATSLSRYLQTGTLPFSRTPVFGCPLTEPASKR